MARRLCPPWRLVHSLKCASAQVTVPGADPRAEEPARLPQSPPATAGAAGPGRSGATEAGRARVAGPVLGPCMLPVVTVHYVRLLGPTNSPGQWQSRASVAPAPGRDGTT